MSCHVSKYVCMYVCSYTHTSGKVPGFWEEFMWPLGLRPGKGQQQQQNFHFGIFVHVFLQFGGHRRPQIQTGASARQRHEWPHFRVGCSGYRGPASLEGGRLQVTHRPLHSGFLF